MKGDLTALGLWFLLDGLDGAEPGLEAIRPGRKWKEQEWSFMSLRVYSEILLKLWWENLFLLEVNQGSWVIVVRPDACVVNPPKRRM